MINDDNYKEKFKGLQVVEISGESCANCLTLMPMLYELCKARPELTLVHIEASENTVKIMEEYAVDRVPTVLLLDDGEVFGRVSEILTARTDIYFVDTEDGRALFPLIPSLNARFDIKNKTITVDKDVFLKEMHYEN